VSGKNRLLVRVWVALVSATVLSWAIAKGGPSAHVVGVGVLCVAAVKAGLVIHHYMEIGRGSRGWEWFFLVWVLGVTGALVTTSVLG
jgi:hypothetical protein